jgi:hypothetical protein
MRVTSKSAGVLAGSVITDEIHSSMRDWLGSKAFGCRGTPFAEFLVEPP